MSIYMTINADGDLVGGKARNLLKTESQKIVFNRLAASLIRGYDRQRREHDHAQALLLLRHESQ
jgi:hypothetical protein